jgi:hypothetical protein
MALPSTEAAKSSAMLDDELISSSAAWAKEGPPICCGTGAKPRPA